ncbi:hypothetical protein TA3x_000091 [Tundrisphaera sp. TA3]|uniref:hypothetical protein n=1 Tax=Tundrisphaera sp. TA3 TaxID=3435775 RepID=UPI003EBE78F3
MGDEELLYDGVYQTATPIVLDSCYGESVVVSLHFERGGKLKYLFSIDPATEFEEEHEGTVNYQLHGDSRMRFSFGAGWWETDWEGTYNAGRLQLAYRMEVVGGGPAAALKAVVEGDASFRLL